MQPVLSSSKATVPAALALREGLVGLLGAGGDAARSKPDQDLHHCTSPIAAFWYCFSTFLTSFSVRLPWVLWLIMITGARLQHPRQETVSIVNNRSGVVSPLHDAERVFDGLGDVVGPADVAGRAVADPDQVLADRVQPELRVEGRHAVDLRERDAALPVDLGDPLPGDVAVGLLRLLQERDQVRLPRRRSAAS